MTFIWITIRPFLFSKTFLEIINKMTCILSANIPFVSPLTVVLVFQELTFIWSPIRVFRFSITFSEIINKLTCILLAIIPFVSPFTVSFAFQELSFIWITIRVFLFSKTFSETINKLTCILCAIIVIKCPLTIPLIIFKFSNTPWTIVVDDSSDSNYLIIFPLSFFYFTLKCDLCSKTI